MRDERCADENLTTYPPILQYKKRNKKILTGLWSAKELATSSKVKKTRVSILDLLTTADTGETSQVITSHIFLDVTQRADPGVVLRIRDKRM